MRPVHLLDYKGLSYYREVLEGEQGGYRRGYFISPLWTFKQKQQANIWLIYELILECKE
mgnify:CR=1 FL=1